MQQRLRSRKFREVYRSSEYWASTGQVQHLARKSLVFFRPAFWDSPLGCEMSWKYFISGWSNLNCFTDRWLKLSPTALCSHNQATYCNFCRKRYYDFRPVRLMSTKEYAGYAQGTVLKVFMFTRVFYFLSTCIKVNFIVKFAKYRKIRKVKLRILRISPYPVLSTKTHSTLSTYLLQFAWLNIIFFFTNSGAANIQPWRKERSTVEDVYTIGH